MNPAQASLAPSIEAFQSSIDSRNRRGWVACALVAVAFVGIAAAGTGPLYVASALEIVAASCFVAGYLHRNGRVSAGLRAVGEGELGPHMPPAIQSSACSSRSRSSWA